MIPLRRLLLAAALLAAVPGAPSAAPAPADGDAKARGWFTDTPLLTQDGKPVRFYSDVLDGRAVVVGFVFTRCAGACPLLMSKLQKVREGLGGEDVHFVLLSVDPGFDTPQELKRFAEKHRATGREWTFLTGTKQNVSLVLNRLGAYADDPREHNTGFLAANVRTRHWIKIPPQSSPALVAEQVTRLAREDRAAATAAPIR
jgi:protein SCO1/2